MPPQLQGTRAGSGSSGRGDWELLESPSICRMGLGPCWMMLTYTLYTLLAQLAPLLGPIGDRTLKVLEGKGRK